MLNIKLIVVLCLISSFTFAEPFQLPTLKQQDLKALNTPQELFNEVIGCMPIKTRYNLSIDLTARINNSNSFDLENNSFSYGKYYIGIVAKMPLFSTLEIEREYNWELERRSNAAKVINQYFTAIAEQRRAEEEISLFSALEQRAQERVKAGVSETREQVEYLKLNIAAREKFNKAKASKEEARLILEALCTHPESLNFGEEHHD